MKAIYLWLFYPGENISTNYYQWVCANPWTLFRRNEQYYQGFKLICAYIDGLLVLMNDDFSNHWTNTQQVLTKLNENGVKCKI